MPIDAISVSYAQLTRDLLAIAKFLLNNMYNRTLLLNFCKKVMIEVTICR